MVGRIFDGVALLIFLGVALVGAIIAAIAGGPKHESAADVGKRALEAALAAFGGGFLAHTFIGVLLSWAGDSRGAGMVVGWGFFLWPGAVDTIAWIFGRGPVLTTPGTLLLLAAIVGSGVGMMDGLWRTQPWVGFGVGSFLLDVTWGLAATTNGALLHLVNFAWGEHQADGRTSSHRYASGFRIMPRFAFTQGAVMSDLTESPGQSLWNHEMTHVWQNRIFGPLFTLSYVSWMVLMAVPGAIAGLVNHVGLGEGVNRWSYFNNFWEWWAYKNGGGHSDVMIWSDGLEIAASVVYFVAFTVLLVILVPLLLRP